MPSAFVWIDDSEKQRQRMQDALDVFTVKGTRDELGLAVIRDGFSDLLFPGTGALQTRAAYFLFIPWIYRALEKEGVKSSEVRRVARKWEIDLIFVLQASDDSEGTIGTRAGLKLKRLPSSIYWTGLGKLGIRLFPASQDAYHRSLDTWQKRRRNAEPSEEGGHVAATPPNWHAGIPDPPTDWPAKATLRLRQVDAQYLRERVRSESGNSLLARLDGQGHYGEDMTFVWEHPVAGELSKADDPPSRTLHRQLAHARCFSEAMYGASILYNLIVAEQIPGGAERADGYRRQLDEWHTEIDARMAALRDWNLSDLWQLLAEADARVDPRARDFVSAWVELARSDTFRTNTAGESARRLISMREKRLKGSLARIDNPTVQERWEGDSGLSRFGFRWGNARIVLNDISSALDGGGNA
jgi:hypothetical protein